ncbi:MAG: GAF domain-containing protein, partial [Chloroflexi bacterium]|nr:GAF domain-containing protein [Chloroflexota bacterium]
MPAFITGLGMDLLLVVHSSNPLIPEPVRRICLIIGITGFFFTLLFFYLLVPLTEHYPYLKFIFSLSTGILIGLLAYIDVEYVGELSFIYINVIVLITSILFGRSSTYALLFSTVITGTVVSIGLRQLPLADVWMHELSLLAIGTVINETQWRMNKVLYRQLQRLEAINRISRNVSSSIETAEVLSLLSASIQNTLDADTYFIALWNEDKLELQLLYDDGIFFPNTELDPENTLSGWVIKNNKPLLIGDVLEEASAIGILPTTIGQPKLSRSWLGVPLETSDLKLGIVVVAAYQPDKYDQGDLDLLQNIAQQAALAIDNAYHHAQVEKRSQQDSLTSALTHGYFLEVMQKAANECLESGAPLSLIM